MVKLNSRLYFFSSIGAGASVVVALLLVLSNNSPVQPPLPVGTPVLPNYSNNPGIPVSQAPQYAGNGSNVPVQWGVLSSSSLVSGGNPSSEGTNNVPEKVVAKQQPQQNTTTPTSNSGGGVHYPTTYYATYSSSGDGPVSGVIFHSTGGSSNSGNQGTDQTKPVTSGTPATNNTQGTNATGSNNNHTTGNTTTSNDLSGNTSPQSPPQYTSELVCADPSNPNINQTNIPLNSIVQCHTHNTDPSVNAFHFWITGPDGKIADSGVQPYLTNNDVKFDFKANSSGQYVVNTDYYDKQGHVFHLSCDMLVSFFVLPESSLGTVSLMASSMAALGVFVFYKKRAKTSDSH